jgi:outer membrane protein OmpA-like peptidoglycan-associated protein
MTARGTHSLFWAFGLAIALGTLACGGSTLPTKQLVDARRAYGEAKATPGAHLTPDGLTNAGEALDAAERAHKQDPGSSNEKQLAAVAERKAREAQAMGKAAEAKLAEDRARAADAPMSEEQASQSQAQRDEMVRAAQERQAADERFTKAMSDLPDAIAIARDESSTVLTIPGSLLFAQGTSILLPSARGNLDPIARVLQEQPAANMIRVEAYTDSHGASERNQKLSQERAEAVRDYLVKCGVDAQQLQALGRGIENPIASNDSAEGRATNRRVLIVIPTRTRPAPMAATGGPRP